MTSSRDIAPIPKLPDEIIKRLPKRLPKMEKFEDLPRYLGRIRIKMKVRPK